MFPSLDDVARVHNISEAFGNKILYEMCSNYPEHRDTEVVGGKIWLIGRAYSASLERKKPQGTTREALYEQVTNAIVESDIHHQIAVLKAKNFEYLDAEDEETIGQILNLHNTFIRIVVRHAELNKRSLASKYLHFHLPPLVYIYDSIARYNLQLIYPRHRVKHKFRNTFDYTYTKFFLTMMKLREDIRSQYGIRLTSRQLDRLLLKY